MDDIWVRLWKMKIELVGGKGREGIFGFFVFIFLGKLMFF